MDNNESNIQSIFLNKSKSDFQTKLRKVIYRVFSGEKWKWSTKFFSDKKMKVIFKLNGEKWKWSIKHLSEWKGKVILKQNRKKVKVIFKAFFGWKSESYFQTQWRTVKVIYKAFSWWQVKVILRKVKTIRWYHGNGSDSFSFIGVEKVQFKISWPWCVKW